MDVLKLQARYKFIRFEERGFSVRGHKAWICKNNRSNDPLGYVEWNTAWTTFVLIPEGQTMWSPDCLQDVIHFISRINP